MIKMTLSEMIPQVLLSPYVIGITLFIIIYGSIISAAASNKEHVRKPVPKKTAKIKKPSPAKPGLAKNEDASELGLD
ncbi:MAG: hypothetical protein LBK61_09135 [Spirochaetaceae bacterium]|jgi:hypothetical protein|nr:hypothetical protein [Spirochaetaceae bacterium]